MPMIRVNALRSLRFTGARATARASAGRTQVVAKRFASSGGSHGGHGAPSSDLPWLLSALVVTPPSVWYLWPEKSHAEHHGDHGHDEKHAEKPSEEDQSAEDESAQEESAPAEQADAPEETEEKAEQSEEKSEDKSKDGEEKAEESPEKPEDKPEDGEEKAEGGDDKEEDSEDSGKSSEGDSQEKPRGGKVDGVQFKGKMKPDSEGYNDTRKTEPNPESRGTQKRRIDSGLGKNLGEGTQPSDQATAKPESSDVGDISYKQKGFSTTDTRHSIKIDERDDKSKKGTGEPETAKSKGTIDPAAPVRGGPGQNSK